jgi:hypothetical protein
MAIIASSDLASRKIHTANYCGNRFCPVCSWRAARKDALKLDVLMRHIEQTQGKAYIMLTLTAPNVPGDMLSEALDAYNAAYKRLCLLSQVKAVNRGYVRKLEVTYNAKTNTYHPHMHVIMAVDKQYFAGRTYLRRDKWLAMWRQAMRDDSITQVHVTRVDRSSASKAQAEIAKYVAKDSDLLISPDVFAAFYAALKGRQIITYNGLFAAANKAYKAGDLDSYKTPDTTTYVYLLLYRWGLGAYVETERRSLTPEERAKINGQLLDEAEADTD